MSAFAGKAAIPGLFPEPKDVTLTGGNTELSPDVRLVTNNVLPLQRKAMRGVLAEAGVRVVANKKKYVIEAIVEDESAFDLTDVPETARGEYYQLELRDSVVTLRTPSQLGALWATQTLGAIYKAFANGYLPPNMTIRDWPVLTSRGIFVENKWGPDRMKLPDWCLLIDRLSALKLNRLGIGLYGCWGNCRFEGSLTEFLQVPVPEHEELRKEHHLRWYSPDFSRWNDQTYLSPMFEENFLAEVVNYGREKGVTVMPFVNSLGHNTLIPRLLPAVSAKDKSGTPRGLGYSIADPATRRFIEGFYGSIIERYFPGGIDYFHIQLDEVLPDNPDPADPGREASPWCQARVSAKHTDEENLRDYLLWLVSMLTTKGVRHVVMWNDQLTRHMKVLNEAFIRQLDKAGLKNRLILHWWWYSNEALDEQTHVKLGAKLGLDGWVAPMTGYYNWMRYDYRRPNIERMLGMAHAEGASGAVSYAVHDPGYTDHEALLAGYAWSGMEGGSADEVQEKWAECFGVGREAYLSATEAIIKASTEIPALAHTYHYTYTYHSKDLPWPRPYPEEALDKLAAMKGVNVPAQLREAAALAKRAAETLSGVLSIPGLGETPKAAAKSLRAEAARIEGLAIVFAFLFELRKGKSKTDAAATCAKIRAQFLEFMRVVELGKPTWVVPASMHSLSLLLEFLDQLQADLEAGSKVRWSLG
jgi:hypothetical protein